MTAATASEVFPYRRPPPPAARRIVQWRYGDPSLPVEALVGELGLASRPYTYLVATSELERSRRALAPAQQEGLLKFDKVLRRMIGRPLLTRTEEQLCLRRGIERDVADPNVASQVRHDLFAWLEALAEMAERGLNLTGHLDDALRRRFVSRNALYVIGRLQAAQRAQMREISATRRPFEQAARELLCGEQFHITRDVVMEGFTFLTPLQRLFVDSCLRAGSTLHFIYPYAARQQRGFAVMRRTYEPYKDRSVIRYLPEAPPADDDQHIKNLPQLRRELFSDSLVHRAREVGATDGSVTIEGYPHRHAEVAACVRRIAEYVCGGEYRPEEIAIVARDPVELHALLQEQVRLQGAVDRNDVPLRLNLPPRMLLLTPIGRFALTLYEIRRGGTFKMSAEQFETMIASGWLGATLQDTTDAFNAVRAQMFDRCESQRQWNNALAQLSEISGQAGAGVADGSRLPSAAIGSAVVRHWRAALQRIEELSERLFADGGNDATGRRRPISQRVEQLLSELAALDPNLRQAEREIIERIRDAMTELTQVEGYSVTAEEFGDILNGLVKEYQQTSQAGEEVGGAGQVMVTTPEGIDSCGRRVVFYVAVDDQRVPRPAPQPWPLWELELDANQEKERYLFLAVVRAAQEKLHLSYARMGEGNTYRPSPYLEEAVRVLGFGAITDVSPVAPEPKPMPACSRTCAPIPTDDYRLHEIAQFRLCPYRYWIEHVDPRARLCRDRFQMAYEAQAAWYDAIFLAVQGQQAAGEGAIASLLLGEMQATRERIRAMFPVLRDLHWQAAEDHVRRSLVQEAQFLAGKDGIAEVRFERAPSPLRYKISKGRRVIRVACEIDTVAERNGRLLPIFQPLTYREWLLPTVKSDDPTAETVQRDGMALLPGLYHAVQWWQNCARPLLTLKASPEDAKALQDSAQRKAEIIEAIDRIEAGHFPKNPGGHCMACPAKGLCLGVAEEAHA